MAWALRQTIWHKLFQIYSTLPADRQFEYLNIPILNKIGIAAYSGRGLNPENIRQKAANWTSSFFQAGVGGLQENGDKSCLTNPNFFKQLSDIEYSCDDYEIQELKKLLPGCTHEVQKAILSTPKSNSLEW